MKCPEKDCGGELTDVGKTPKSKETWMCDLCGKKFTKEDVEKIEPSK